MNTNADPNLIPKPLGTCHFCLEPIQQQTPICPICRHRVHPDLLGIPLPLLDRSQRLRLILDDMDFVLNSESTLLRGDKKQLVGYDSDYNQRHNALSLREQVVRTFKERSPALMDLSGDIEDDAAFLYEMLAGEDRTLKAWLAQSRDLRETAYHLSHLGNDLLRIQAFQRTVVEANGWAPYGSFAEREKVFDLLKERVTYNLELSVELSEPWSGMKPLVLGSGTQKPIYYIRLEKKGVPYLRADIHETAFPTTLDPKGEPPLIQRAAVWGNLLAVGIGHYYFLVDLESRRVQTQTLKDYFKTVYYGPDYLLVVEDKYLLKLNGIGHLEWERDFDPMGLLIQGVVGSQIHCESMGDDLEWRSFKVDLSMGQPIG